MAQVRLNTVHYNAARGAFEARVDVIRDGKVFRYPAQIQGPSNMGFDRISSGLAQQALRMSDSARA